jgi:hypothetical protein
MPAPAVGIICQYDESAYGYRRTGDAWKRIRESEQDDYTRDRYFPQQIFAVHILHTSESGPTYFLTLGNQWGCASAWHPVYYRVWRADRRLPPAASGRAGTRRTRRWTFSSSSAREGSTPASITGRRSATTRSPATWCGGSNPVALSPRDFVDKWLTQDAGPLSGRRQSPVKSPPPPVSVQLSVLLPERRLRPCGDLRTGVARDARLRGRACRSINAPPVPKSDT